MRQLSCAFPVPYSLFPIPYSLFPIPYSLFPIPYSLFPVPSSFLSRLDTPCINPHEHRHARSNIPWALLVMSVQRLAFCHRHMMRSVVRTERQQTEQSQPTDSRAFARRRGE
jgi:hypothetical protein